MAAFPRLLDSGWPALWIGVAEQGGDVGLVAPQRGWAPGGGGGAYGFIVANI